MSQLCFLWTQEEIKAVKQFRFELFVLLKYVFHSFQKLVNLSDLIPSRCFLRWKAWNLKPVVSEASSAIP